MSVQAEKKEVTIEIGEWSYSGVDKVNAKKFKGSLLNEGRQYLTSNNRWVDWQIYLTAKKKILVYYSFRTCWQGESNHADYEIFDDIPNNKEFHISWKNHSVSPSYSYHDRYTKKRIQTHLDNLQVPGSLIQCVLSTIGEDPAETLDI